MLILLPDLSTTLRRAADRAKEVPDAVVVNQHHALSRWPSSKRLDTTAMTVEQSLNAAVRRGLLPGWLYDHVFAFRGLRVPPRIGQLMLMAAGVLAAFGLSRLMDAVRSHHRMLQKYGPQAWARRGLDPAVATA